MIGIALGIAVVTFFTFESLISMQNRQQNRNQ